MNRVLLLQFSEYPHRKLHWLMRAHPTIDCSSGLSLGQKPPGKKTKRTK